MKCGFIGTGVIASAIIRGMIKNEAIKPVDICVFDVLTEKSHALGKELKLSVADSAVELVNSCEAVFLTVKPDKAGQALAELQKPIADKNPLIISVVAGKTFSFLKEAIGADTPVARVMPNTNAAVCESMSVICYNEFVSEEQKAAVLRFFNAVGQTVIAENEDKFAAMACLGGCSPAYTYMFIDYMARFAHKAGIDKRTATAIAAQTVLGSAKMVLENPLHPAQLVDNVCSPGGTTIEGVCELDRRGFGAAVVAALDRAMEKNGRI